MNTPDLNCWILGRAGRNLSRNEFRAGDYLRFGRVWYHVKETSTHPIEWVEDGELSEESDRSLDNTHADGAVAAQHNASVLASDKNISRMGRVAMAMARQQIASTAQREADASPVSVPLTHQNRLSASVGPFGDALNRTDEWSVSELEEQPNKTTYTCRICLTDGNYEEESKIKTSNPLVSPWKCAGTMKYLHYGCLKAWVDSKKKVKSAMHITSYFWKDIRWELWHHKLPDTVTYRNKTMKIVDYHVPKGSPYVVLETYSKNNDKTRVIHVLNYGGTSSVTLGRCRDANIRIADNSVSRMHAELIYYHGKYYQSDMSSRFGTLRVLR